MNTVSTAAAVTLAAVLAGCASQGTNPQLAEARNAYSGASTDPAIAANAPLELQQAREALNRAEAAQRDGASGDDVASLAYAATRDAQAAREVAVAKQAQSTVATGDLRRSNAQLQRANAQLQSELDQLKAQPTDRGYVMTLGDVLFDTGKATMTSGARERVDRLARFLKEHPERTVRIEGYTDNTGSAGFNLQLSEQRADAVRDELVSQGIGPDRVVTVGRGEAQPVASNANEAGRQANRRVEIVISDNRGTVAQTR